MSDSVTICYVHVPGDLAHEIQAVNFLDSYDKFPPNYEHDFILISQLREPDEPLKSRFLSLPSSSIYVHDDSGWDIGGYVALAKSGKVETDALLCCGGSTTFRKSGWLMRLMEVWDKHGPGFYGTLSSYQCRPHFNTNGFMVPPIELAMYPHPVNSQPERYQFEHGREALWWRMNQAGKPTKLVTWSGEYDWKEFRKPDNISCRGDQSECLMFFRINYQFEQYRATDGVAHNNLMYLTDAHVTDPYFRELLKGLTPLGEVVEG